MYPKWVPSEKQNKKNLNRDRNQYLPKISPRQVSIKHVYCITGCFVVHSMRQCMTMFSYNRCTTKTILWCDQIGKQGLNQYHCCVVTVRGSKGNVLHAHSSLYMWVILSKKTFIPNYFLFRGKFLLHVTVNVQRTNQISIMLILQCTTIKCKLCKNVN